MKQHVFYREIVRLMEHFAKENNPNKLSVVIYGHIKQHPENVKVDRAWGEMLRNMKILLKRHYSWPVRDIHMFFINLKKFTKYMEKSI